MQMKALRSANFLKLSSNSSTSEAYCVTSISAGTPAGYCLSQIRSMVTPLQFRFRLTRQHACPASLILGRYWAIGPPVASRRDVRDDDASHCGGSPLAGFRYLISGGLGRGLVAA